MEYQEEKIFAETLRKKLGKAKEAELWFCRLLAIWCLEVSGCLTEEPLFARELPEAVAQERLRQICCRLALVFPGLFEAVVEPPVLVGNGVMETFWCLEPTRFDLKQQETVARLGWLYQSFQSAKKEEAFACVAANRKIPPDFLPAATQLFTPEWLACYLTENGIGRYWAAQRPEWCAPEHWRYYLLPKEPETLQPQLIAPQQLTVLDPCVGGGHILLRAFDVLMDIYRGEGYSEKEAAEQIVLHNLFGLEVDDAVAGLAQFAVAMQAWRFGVDIFAKPCVPRIYSIQESGGLTAETVRELPLDGLSMQQCRVLEIAVDVFAQAKIYGACLQMPPELRPELCREMARKLRQLAEYDVQAELLLLAKLMDQAELLAQTYAVVVTNPPYMGKKSLSSELAAFLERTYPLGKSELYAAFVLRCRIFTQPGGCLALLTMHTWMFLYSYRAFREQLLEQMQVLSLVHTGAATFTALNAFNALAAAFVLRNTLPETHMPTLFLRLVDYLQTQEKQQAFFAPENRFWVQQNTFFAVPGTPVVYWAGQGALRAFSEGEPLCTLVKPKVGLQTGDNATFVRRWFEVDWTDFCTTAENAEQAVQSGAAWFPYSKGGAFCKWYGMHEFAVYWKENGQALRQSGRAVLRNECDYFKAGITWSLFGFENFAVRYKTTGFLFDVSGASLFPPRERTGELLAFLCSKVAFYLLSLLAPTVNFQAGNVGSLPVLSMQEHRVELDALAEENCRMAKQDWDNFEVSWDFLMHPLLQISKELGLTRLLDCFAVWQQQAQRRYDTIYRNEVRINTLLIARYGLQEELEPEVAPRDISVRRAELARDLQELLSYLAGCLFGRYHPEQPGLWFAGGKWKGTPFCASENCLLLAPEPLRDVQHDFAAQLISLLGRLFGKAQLSENLRFIARGLGFSGEPVRAIYQYCYYHFYKDHLRRYKKRPIYWQLQNGSCKALFYLHRVKRRDFLVWQQHLLQQPGVVHREYLQAFEAALPKLCAMDLNCGVLQNYHAFQNLQVGNREEAQTISLLTDW